MGSFIGHGAGFRNKEKQDGCRAKPQRERVEKRKPVALRERVAVPIPRRVEPDRLADI